MLKVGLSTLLVGLVTSCASEATPDCGQFAEVGPYVAGVRTIDIDGLLVEVWYPADAAAASMPADVYDMRADLPEEMQAAIDDAAPTRFTTLARRDAPEAQGSFPLVLFSHGLGGFRRQSSFLTAHLATWGFVVAAPEHAERNLAAVLTNQGISDMAVPQLRSTVEALGAAPHVDASRIALMGHSAGGGAVAALVDDESFGARAWISLASIAAPARAVPGLILGGGGDQIAVAEVVARIYDEIDHAAKRYVSIGGAGHLAFSDICLIGRERGGVLQIAQDSGLDVSDLVVMLGSDGCRAGDLPAEDAWPVIRHFTTATLRHQLLEMPPEGLEPEAGACFEGLVITDRSGS